MKRFVIGIDVGFKGGISILDIVAKTLCSRQTPIIKPTKKKKTDYDIHGIISLLQIPKNDIICAVVEKVNTMPGQGVSSSGKLMYGLGGFIFLIAQLLYPNTNYLTPTGSSWKKKLNLTSDKELSFLLADKIFPKCTKFWSSKKGHIKNRDGVAEASLLAYYGAKEMGITDEELCNITPI